MAKRHLVKLCMETRMCAGVPLPPQTLCTKLTPKAPLGPHPLLPLLAQCFTPSPFFPLPQLPFLSPV